MRCMPAKRRRAMRHQAMTLIEVMCGMVILGTLVMSLLVVRSRSLHQWALAERRQEAITAADKLLSGWWASPQEMPRKSHGILPEDSMAWQTHVLDNSVAKEMGGEVVRLEIFDNRDSAAPAEQNAGENSLNLHSQALATVDVLLPVPEQPKGQNQP
jgi:prepilin-type N-terminal cleavage/methylation domain-containing protein